MGCMMTRAFNFSAGPAVLPERVLLEAQATLLALPASGFSPLEMSHRSPWFEEVIAEAEANLRGLLTIPANYRVLFLQGGASLQFSMVPMNLLRGSGSRAEYVVTGSWGTRAVKEAAIEGEVVTIWTGEASGFDRTPSPSELSPSGDAAYLHFTSNETIQGVEFPPSVQPEPDGQVPLVCDASSDLLSRPVEIGRYGLVYAGAQKNAGSAGLTIVIIREDLLERAPDDLPTMLAYRTHADAGSLYNTPPVFSVYILMLVTRWLRDDIGGLEKMAALNEE